MNERKIKHNNQLTNKKFGFFFGLFLLIISLVIFLVQESWSFYIISIAFAFILVALINPKLLSIPNSIWFKFSLFVGNTLSMIVMIILFYFVILPTGIILRIFNKDVMPVKKDENLRSYWVERSNKHNNFEDQF